MMRLVLAGTVFSLFVAVPRGVHAEACTITVSMPERASTDGFEMGQSRAPDGSTIALDNRSLRLDGKPWIPVMGEFHFSRYPENEWRGELLKMKAGGIDIIATYVFWIHHEEIEGQFDWSGRRSLRQFVHTAGDVGLKAVVRCGPWCHGEVRNGGLPDWILQKGWRTRSDDPNYLDKVRVLYGQIANQLKGLLWKDGGPVIGIQFENEYGGPAQHLLTLKQIARDAGLDVPLYTRTGWPGLRTPMPFGEIVPLYGAYAEGFWDRELTPMPGNYWTGFRFSPLRTDSAIATDQLGRRQARDAADAAEYPYLTCEMGGGMMNSYHRRILIYPTDVASTMLVKLGSGSTLPGYYMYHGGVNPEGKLTTLMESQATGYWNDMPVKNYDFQAPLGQYGQIRPHYHLLRRLHLFLHDYGSTLAQMPAVMPDGRPAGRDDITTLRWAARSDGVGGLVFVNNYERLRPMPAKEDVQFTLRLPSGSLTFPVEPVTIPADSCFFWPFSFDLGYGARLAWATAQPVCAIDEGRVRTVFFAQTKGVPAQFACEHAESGIIVRSIEPSREVALELPGNGGRRVQIVLLSEADSLALWKGTWQGRRRAFLTHAGLVIDGNALRLTVTDPGGLSVGVYPTPISVVADGKALVASQDGVFACYTPAAPAVAVPQLAVECVQSAGPPRTIPLGNIRQAVAAAPEDVDFEKAAVWRIKLPAGLDMDADPVLRLHYAGDVARVTLDGRLLTDDFYNGNAFDVGLRRHAPDILRGDLRVAILPLRKDAPIYMAKEARPEFGGAESMVALKRVEIVPRRQAELTPPQVFDVRQFGAKGDGSTLDTEAIQEALDECGRAGGGIVRFAPGTYLSKPITLRTRTTVQLDGGAALQATGNQVDFMKEPGDWLSARSGSDFVPFITGKDLTDIAITGAGVIDGNGQVWWPAAEEARRKTSGYTLPRPNLIVLTRCKNVEITGVTICNAPKFHLVPTDCEDVLIEGVTFKAPEDAPNTDAIDPSVSRRVRISRCIIDVGDDNIAIKSGKKMEGREFACEDITVSDCVFLHGHGMSIGSETVGGVQNVTVERCTFQGTENGIRIKSPRGKGGTIDGLRCRDITMIDVDPALTISAYYPKIPAEDEVVPATAETPVIRNIEITNLTATCPKEAGVIVGLPESLATNICLTNVTISAQTGLTIRNAKGVKLTNVRVQTQQGPPVIVRNAEVDGAAAGK